MSEVSQAGRGAGEELEQGLHLRHHLSPRRERAMFATLGFTLAFAYGVCSALILDEFALWLNLRDVYWERQGRESVEALAIFGGVFLWGVLIWPFGRAMWRHLRGRTPTPAHAGRRVDL